MGNGNEKYVAEAISHEAGHSLGLEHDGNSTTTYYTGEGSGATGWAPIMGVGYYQELTQWSQGEYYDANNTEDDLSIITGNNGFGYRIDDHGDSNESATAMTVDGNTISANGIISQNTDYDVFSFSTGTGNVNLNILPAERGANLDILAELYDSSGTLIATSNPFESLNANFSLNLAAGQYYLSVTGTGKEGAYSDYGSLGQYSINGNVAIVENDFLSIEATDAIKSEGNSDSTEFTFTVNRSGNITQETQVAWTVTGTGFNPVSSNDFVGGVRPGGIVQFAANQTSQTITVNIAGDTILENDETFFVSLNNPSANTIISVADAEGIIINDDFNNYVAPTISIDDVAVNENNGSAIFTVTRSGDLNDTVTLEYNTYDGKGKNGAKAGSDYIGDGGIITFNPGDSTVSLAVSLIDDTTSESNESFFVNLSNASNNASISDFQGIATILNDDFSSSTTDSKGGGGRGGSKKKAPEFIIETSQIDDLTGSSRVDPFMLGSQDLFYETNLNNNNYQAIENIPFGEDFRELYGNGGNNFANNSPFNSENTAIFAYDEAIDVVMA
ncbi:MAG: Calx-beta domain-containing protein [Prochloraceae cyanobacterium]|nr:Calx-beta domain-containing protein [Prochloraceae cyanobacterium]